MFIVPMSRTARTFGQACRPASAHSIERLLDSAFADRWPGDASLAPSSAIRTPALDVTETKTAYVVTLDMPGVSKEAVKVSIDGRQVSVEAEPKPLDANKDGEHVVYRERSAAKFSRSFTLPAEVDQSDSSAKIDNGVLILRLAKRSATQSAHITVN